MFEVSESISLRVAYLVEMFLPTAVSCNYIVNIKDYAYAAITTLRLNRYECKINKINLADLIYDIRRHSFCNVNFDWTFRSRIGLTVMLFCYCIKHVCDY